MTTLTPDLLPSVRDVLLVGHCGPDSFLLRNAVRRIAPEARVHFINDTRSLNEHLHPDALLLINRELDGSFIVDSGIELIGHLARELQPPRTMLISNFQWAQDQAVAAGAIPGFGKATLATESTSRLLKSALNRA